MILEFPFERAVQPARENDFSEIFAAGRRLAESISGMHLRGKRKGRPRRGQAERILARAPAAPEKFRTWLADNVRLLRTAARGVFEFGAGLHQFPVSLGPFGEIPRVCLLARVYLECSHDRFTEDGFVAFMNGFQEVMALEMGEIWGLKPGLQLAVLERLEADVPESWPDLMDSLRHVGETAWKDVFESVSLVDRALGADPADAYWQMDFESRDLYRRAIADLAKHSSRTELEVAGAAVELAREVPPDGSRAALRRSHAGYYLLDDGLPALKSRIHYKTPFRHLPKAWAVKYPAVFYLAGIEILTFITVACLNS